MPEGDGPAVATEAAPPAQDGSGAVQSDERSLTKDWNMEGVFDKAFPSTAPKKEETAPAAKESPPPPAVPEAKTEPKKAEPIQTTPLDGLPDFLMGDKPPEPAATEPEPDIPAPRQGESKGLTNLRSAYYKLRDDSKAKADAFQARIAELEKAPPPPSDAETEIKRLTAANQEMTAALERAGIEYDPNFRRAFTERREQLVNDAHALLKEANIDPSLWDRAISLTGVSRATALDEIYDQLPRSIGSELGSTAREIRSLDSQRDALLADKKGLRERLQQENLRQQREQMQQHEKSTLETMARVEKDLLETHGFEVLRKSENPQFSKWNEEVETLKANAKKILLEVTDPEVMARAAYLAPAAIRYKQLYELMRDRWKEANQKLKAIEKAEPTLESKGEAPDTSDEKLTFAQAAAKRVFGN